MLNDPHKRVNPMLDYADVVAAAVGFGLAISLPILQTPFHPEEDSVAALLGLGLAASLAWPALLRQMGVDHWQALKDAPQYLPKLAAAGACAIALQGVGVYLLRAPVSPLFALVSGVTQAALIAGLRLIVLGSRQWFHPHARLTRNVVIVGSGPRAAYVRDVIEENPQSGLLVLGFLDAESPPNGPAVAPEQIFKLGDMAALLADQVVDEVIVAYPRGMLGSIVQVVDACAAAGVPITLLSDLFGDYLPAPRTTRFGALPALTFAPVHHHVLLLITKRLIDIAGSAAMLILAAPVIALGALLVKISSPGPVFFRQVRCGLNGRHFVIHKLRTMVVNADAKKEALAHLNEMDGPVFKIEQDPRITPIGRFLRRTSIDELPQLWNVLTGDMSLVGPRPPVPTEVAEYETFQRRRLSMRPGLTCIWQVSGRNRIGFDEWVRLDLEYIDTWSLSNDFWILLKTVPAVFDGRGAS